MVRAHCPRDPKQRGFDDERMGSGPVMLENSMTEPRRPPRIASRSSSREGLYDPAFERDSCGVGFVADLSGRKSHATVQSGLQVLRNLQHRGACGCDQDTGDGAGILMQLPDLFFRSEARRRSRIGCRPPATTAWRSSSCPGARPSA